MIDNDKIIVSRWNGYYFASYKGTALRGIGDTIDEAIRDLMNIIKSLK